MLEQHFFDATLIRNCSMQFRTIEITLLNFPHRNKLSSRKMCSRGCTRDRSEVWFFKLLHQLQSGHGRCISMAKLFCRKLFQSSRDNGRAYIPLGHFSLSLSLSQMVDRGGRGRGKGRLCVECTPSADQCSSEDTVDGSGGVGSLHVTSTSTFSHTLSHESHSISPPSSTSWPSQNNRWTCSQLGTNENFLGVRTLV